MADDPQSHHARTEAAGGIVLLVAAAAALVWANSPWRASYSEVWGTHLTLGLRLDLLHWVNDGLMAVFFFVMGLEIKREAVAGDLGDRRTAALPALAALGGMVVPALLYVVVTAGRAGGRGWAIPMPTDIAFAVAVLALLGSRVPASLRLFVLTLAVVDDIGAIVVIAFFYTAGLHPLFLLGAGAVVALVVGLRRAGADRLPLFLACGVALWLTVHASGVHATVAGVVLGLLTPVPRSARLERLLRPWIGYVVLPVFALANAGVHLRADVVDAPGALAVMTGVALGLVVGKVLGITGAARLAVKAGLGRAPGGTTWPMVAAAATVGGIGFTVSLFIAELAFAPGPLQDAAKLGVLGGSVVAGAVGALALRQATGGVRTAPG